MYLYFTLVYRWVLYRQPYNFISFNKFANTILFDTREVYRNIIESNWLHLLSHYAKSNSKYCKLIIFIIVFRNGRKSTAGSFGGSTAIGIVHSSVENVFVNTFASNTQRRVQKRFGNRRGVWQVARPLRKRKIKWRVTAHLYVCNHWQLTRRRPALNVNIFRCIWCGRQAGAELYNWKTRSKTICKRKNRTAFPIKL